MEQKEKDLIDLHIYNILSKEIYPGFVNQL